MVTLFGTDGVRGVVNATLLPELAFQLEERLVLILAERQEYIVFW